MGFFQIFLVSHCFNWNIVPFLVGSDICCRSRKCVARAISPILASSRIWILIRWASGGNCSIKEISSFQTGQLVALATDVSPWIHTHTGGPFQPICETRETKLPLKLFLFHHHSLSLFMSVLVKLYRKLNYLNDQDQKLTSPLMVI